jgi:hypothetical protein
MIWGLGLGHIMKRMIFDEEGANLAMSSAQAEMGVDAEMGYGWTRIDSGIDVNPGPYAGILGGIGNRGLWGVAAGMPLADDTLGSRAKAASIREVGNLPLPHIMSSSPHELLRQDGYADRRPVPGDAAKRNIMKR